MSDLGERPLRRNLGGGKGSGVSVGVLGELTLARISAGDGHKSEQPVESECGAVAVDRVCLLPPLSIGGAQVTLP